MTINTQNQSDLASRLRCRYPMGPIGDNGEPEFGWRDFRGPAPEGMVLPAPLMLEAANVLDAQTAEIAAMTQHANFLNSEIARLRGAIQGLLDALPSATTHPAIKRAKDALLETDHD